MRCIGSMMAASAGDTKKNALSNKSASRMKPPCRMCETPGANSDKTASSTPQRDASIEVMQSCPVDSVCHSSE
eukprot:scaffold325430_cov88-Tisochrysis_lutea.AAC.1